jgi:hypothetical protein
LSAPTRHLVTVWNPSYANAMDETIQLLLDRARDFRAGKIREEDDVFVWWGKIRSGHRQTKLPHLDEVLAIEADIDSETDPREVHLYITDYRSLYVAHVGEITRDDVHADGDGVPAFYRDKDCDCWFRLFDIRRLVTDDTVEVVEQLKQLANTRYNGMPVSIYGGMVDLPIIATRKEEVTWFDDDARASLTGGQYWVEFDAQRSGVGRMERELRDNLLGEKTWAALDPAVRSFIATAETLFRNHRDDPAFDFTPVVIAFAKAFEVQVNIILRRALSSVAPKDRTYAIDGTSRDIARGQNLTLGQLARLIADEQHLNTFLKKRLNGDWFTTSLPPILRDLGERRNPAAHSDRVPSAKAAELRNRLLGVGQLGALVELTRVTVR